MSIVSFRDLLVWQRAMRLTAQVYALTERFPHSEQYGLARQLRRAAVSIPSNIAEGHARRTGHFLSHLNTAIGSEAELQTQLELAWRLEFVLRDDVLPLLAETAAVGRMLRGLAASVARSRHGGPTRDSADP